MLYCHAPIKYNVEFHSSSPNFASLHESSFCTSSVMLSKFMTISFGGTFQRKQTLRNRIRAKAHLTPHRLTLPSAGLWGVIGLVWLYLPILCILDLYSLLKDGMCASISGSFCINIYYFPYLPPPQSKFIVCSL